MFLKKTVIHPFLIALYPVIALYSSNIDRTPFTNIVRLLLLLTLAAILLLTFFRLLTGSWQRAGLISSLFLILFSSYGHVYYSLQDKHIMGLQIGQADYIAALFAAIFIFFGWFFWRKLRSLDGISRTLNIIALIMVALPLVTSAPFLINLVTPKPSLKGCAPELEPAPSSLPRPDVYYLILDEYGRSDMLAQVMGYNNTSFIDQLRQRGFYIAEESYSNYAISVMSMSSSLNYCYLNDHVSKVPEDSAKNMLLLANSIQNSGTRAYFEKAGYRFITFATGYSPSDIPNSDLYMKPANYLNAFEMAFIHGSALAIFSDPIQAAQSRATIRSAFENLAALPDREPEIPKFVFAHIQTNHAPFVFGPKGESIPLWGFQTSQNAEGLAESINNRTYASVYRDQAEYANQLILNTVDEILRKSKVKPIIILQGDHGTQSLLNWASLEETCVKERHAILNAYYFPDQDYSRLYPSITPVNSFRVLLNQHFGENVPMEKDRVYFSLWDRSYEYIDVTDKMQDCPVPGGSFTQ